MLAVLADVGIAVLLPGLTPADPRLPAEAQASLRALGAAGGASWRALASERGATEAILAEVRAAGADSLGGRSLVVMRARSGERRAHGHAGGALDTAGPRSVLPSSPCEPGRPVAMPGGSGGQAFGRCAHPPHGRVTRPPGDAL